MRNIVYFDDEVRTLSGRWIPTYDFTIVEDPIKDQELVWFHEGYGKMRLYRLHQVDDTNDFIAENLKKRCWTKDERWAEYLENPEKALEEE